jgi:exodeoxyribonuclease V beta subunit
MTAELPAPLPLLLPVELPYEIRPFDATEPLPEGVTVLEASAGTGKTHTVASIVVAEVAAGRPLDELLVVTFTRKATGTLRERVWQRLSEAVHALDADAGADTAADDPLLTHLRQGDPGAVGARRALLDKALSDFDAATIATTHGFCQQVLASLGVAGDAERELEVVDDISLLIDEAVDDLFVRRFHAGQPVLFDRGAARTIAQAVVANPDAKIGKVAPDSEEARLRRRFATTLRDRIKEQKRRGRIVTYDDLLTRLADSIEHPANGAIVAERLRRRYSMAIVDEFQDTDTVQWRILRTAFGAAPSRLVLVGDPKQAVYAFRGGDVPAYLQATRGAHKRTLDVSWRSDQPLLDGLDALFAGAELGAPEITHRPLAARPGAEQPRLLGPAVGAPLTVRILDRATSNVARTPTGLAQKQSARQLIAADVAAEAARLLTSGTTVVQRDAQGTAHGERLLHPGDIAVLVRSHRDAETVRRALQTAGIPAVGHGGASVFTTDAARHWLELLKALESPSFSARLRSVAIGPFFGWEAAELGTATEEQWDRIDERIHDWIRVVRRRGIAALLRRIERTEGLTARLLGRIGGERELSDLRHLAELLDTWYAAHPSSLAVLVTWLTEQIAEADRDAESARRRLESDADAVAIHTIHGAKGLEHPVVLLPSMWEGPWTPKDQLPVFHDEDGERCVGVGGGGDVHEHQMRLMLRERDDEELRLLYVALTRARHRVVVWWATSGDARASAFARLLLGRDGLTGDVAQVLGRIPDEAAIADRLRALAETVPGCIEVEDVSPAGGARFVEPVESTAMLAVSRFEREFDRSWVRTSYSGLTAAAHDAPPPALEVVEVDERVKVDEAPVDDDRVAQDLSGHHEPEAEAPAAALPLGDIVGGPRVGTMVHELLELTDFTAPDLPGALATAADAVGARRLVEGQVDALVAGLVAAVQTPWGPGFADRSLRDIDQANRLDELGFDLPLAGGDEPAGHVTMTAIAEVFATTLPADDPLAGYHERLADPILEASVRGFLTGSIDLVARIGERHVVVDYKTNRLAPAGEALTVEHYRPDELARAMQEAHYPLQAALYLVALHRYLRWRLPAYDPGRHLGGVAYLFLRGMTGEDGPLVGGAPCGVFAWQPPTAFVTTLSTVLDTGEREGVGP